VKNPSKPPTRYYQSWSIHVYATGFACGSSAKLF